MKILSILLLSIFMVSKPPENVTGWLDNKQITIQWEQISEATVVHVYQISDKGLDEIDIAPSSPGYKSVKFYRNFDIEYTYVISEGYLNENNEFYCIGYYEYRDLLKTHKIFIPITRTS